MTFWTKIISLASWLYNTPCPLVFTSWVIPSRLSMGFTQWRGSNQESKAQWWNVMPETRSHKHSGFHLAPPLLLSHLRALTKPGAVWGAALWRGPGGKEPRADCGQQRSISWMLSPSTGCTLGSAAFPAEPWDDHSPCWHLDGSLVRVPEPEHTANLWGTRRQPMLFQATTFWNNVLCSDSSLIQKDLFKHILMWHTE